jgi:hypothetical protein
MEDDDLKRAKLLALVAVAVLGALSSGGSSWADTARDGRPVTVEPWHRSDDIPVNNPRVLRVGVESGFCYEGPKPYIDRVKVVEKPGSNRYPFPSAVITVWVVQVLFPGPGERGCAGLGIDLVRPVMLKRPVDEYHLYDGSSDPPRLVERPKPSSKADRQREAARHTER